MKVLVIQPKIGMGDMIIYLPYIHAISEKLEVKVSLLVKKNSRADQLLINDQHIEEIITLDRTQNNSGSHDGFKGFLNLINLIKKKINLIISSIKIIIYIYYLIDYLL